MSYLRLAIENMREMGEILCQTISRDEFEKLLATGGFVSLGYFSFASESLRLVLFKTEDKQGFVTYWQQRF